MEHSEQLWLPHGADQVNWIFDLEDIPSPESAKLFHQHGELEEASSA